VRPGLLRRSARGLPRVRNLARIGMGVVEHNWMELASAAPPPPPGQQTPRNLLGFKDGTRNVKAEQTELMDSYVWVGAGNRPAVAARGSYSSPARSASSWRTGTVTTCRTGERHRPRQSLRRPAIRRDRVPPPPTSPPPSSKLKTPVATSSSATARRSRPRSLRPSERSEQHRDTLRDHGSCHFHGTHDQRARRRVHADLSDGTLTTAISTRSR